MTISESLKSLENYLVDKSYIDGWVIRYRIPVLANVWCGFTYLYDFRFVPSQADILALNLLKSPPTPATPNVLRWYTHIQSFNGDEKKKFAQKSLNSEVSKIFSSGDKPAPAADDDDDVDLFGSDDEDVRTRSLVRSIKIFVNSVSNSSFKIRTQKPKESRKRDWKHTRKRNPKNLQ